MNLQKINKEIVPLNKKQQVIVALIIIFVFQFFLFFSPLLAQEAVAKELAENETKIALSSLSKSSALDPLAVGFMANKLVFGENDNKESLEKDTEITIKEVEEEVKVISSSVHAITAYNSLPEQTNDQPCITANGFNICQHGIEDTIAANFLPFGTMVRIPDLFGDRLFVVRDRMNRRYPNRVDIWMLEKDDAIQFGIKRSRIEIVELID